ncbi:hypothetical protein JL720_5440 [Aureococcus anophagefferens]|nr:hypothetical protein JL720_5440 [Aureococcus anophagefferens]
MTCLFVVTGKKGAVCRAGVELDSERLVDVPKGETVYVVEASSSACGVARLHVAFPVDGWERCAGAGGFGGVFLTASEYHFVAPARDAWAEAYLGADGARRRAMVVGTLRRGHEVLAVADAGADVAAAKAGAFAAQDPRWVPLDAAANARALLDKLIPTHASYDASAVADARDSDAQRKNCPRLDKRRRQICASGDLDGDTSPTSSATPPMLPRDASCTSLEELEELTLLRARWLRSS